MRKLDILRKMLRNLKTVNDIFHLDVDNFANPGDIDVMAMPLVDKDPTGRMMVVGVVIRHSFPSPDDAADWAAPIWTDDDVFRLTPPDRIKWDD